MSPGWRKAIAVMEIGGGVIGTLGVAAEVARSGFTSAGLPLAAAFLLSAAAGVGLWFDTRFGRVGSVVVQALQLPKVMSGTVAYMMSFGLDVAPLLVARPRRSEVTIDFHLGANHLLAVNDPGLQDGVGVSLVSCVVLWMLWPRRTRPAEVPVEEDSDDPLVRLCRASKMDGLRSP